MRSATHTVTSAIALMEERIAEPITLADVCRHTRVGARTLQQAFRRELGCTPMGYLKQHRLDVARDLLTRASAQETTVTRVASTIGITHLGRFATEYRRRFGVTPSTTLATATTHD